MMSERLNSYEALKAKHEALQAAESAQDSPIEVRVAMGTCAIATAPRTCSIPSKPPLKKTASIMW